MRLTALALIAMALMLPNSVCAQQAEFSLQEGIQALQKQITEMRAMMEDMKSEIVRTRAEAQELRQALQASRGAVNEQPPTPIQNIEEEQQLLSAKIDEQYQTKVESASKYRVRLSGTVLMNTFSTRGAVDNLDFPSFAPQDIGTYSYSRGAIGASLRQSLLGLEVFGPELKGARTSGDLQFDFAGGFPNVPDGVVLGLPRLRTATLRLDWPRTSIVAGQDAPFFSPLSPSSVASIALPAFSYSGNLWTWIPQARFEHRLDVSEGSNVLLQGGVLDPLTGELPPFQFQRTPQAGEAARQPGYATRVSWSRRTSDRQLTIGTGGYYARQNWGARRRVDSWVATSDWTIPVAPRLELSGEFYRGRAIGGLGGGIGRSAIFSGPLTDYFTRVKGLNSIGGWTQLKFNQTERLEWNAAFGQDTVPAKDLRAFPAFRQTYYDPSIARNRSSLVNFIYRPRSDLLFSLEYRRFRTFLIQGGANKADQVNLSMGVLF
jgi:hypothetical protein